jgi:hypothetical protein
MTKPLDNPMGLMGFEFVEFASPTPNVLEPLFEQLGFTRVAKHRSKDVVLYRQGGANFIVNREPKSPAAYFAAEHGPCACGLAFRVKDSHLAYNRALELGAQPMEMPTAESTAVHPGRMLGCTARAVPLFEHVPLHCVELGSHVCSGSVAGQLQAMAIRIEEVDTFEDGVIGGADYLDTGGG